MDMSRVAEVLVAERYAAKFRRPFVNVVGYFKDYDISSLSGDVLLEVKMDTLSATTGNVACEFSYKGEPSGLSSSKADSLVFVIPLRGELWAYEVDTRNLKAELAQKRFVRGGDLRASELKLLPVDTLREIASDWFVLDPGLDKLKAYWTK